MTTHPVLLAAAAAAYFHATGDGLCTWGLGLRPSWRLRRLLLGVVAGLLLNLLLVTNLYMSGIASSAGALVPWLPLLLAAASIGGWIWAPRRADPPAPAPNAAPLVATALLAFAVLLWPTLDGARSGLYYSNNGEFSIYAAVADFVSDHSIESPSDLPLPSLRNREGAAGALVAVVAGVLRVPPILLVQPLAALFAAIFFLGVAHLLASWLAEHHATRGGTGAATALFGASLLSPSNQQIWTSSFFSQYLGFALLGGLLGWVAWGALPGRSDRARTLAAGWVGGLLVSASLLAYPEMAPLLIGFGALLTLPLWRLGWRHLAGAVATAAVVVAASPLGVAFWRDRVASSSLAGGWDLFGPRDDLLFVGSNVLGFSNLFWGRAEPSPFPMAVLGFLALGALAWSVRGFAAARRGSAAAILLSFAAYLGCAALLFARVRGTPMPTNYVAVKFATAFLWVPVVAIATCVAAWPRGAARWLVAGAVGIVAVAQLTQGVAFARGVAEDADATRLGPEDLGIGRKIIPADADVFLFAPPAAKYQLDALSLWKGRAEPDERGRILGRTSFEYTGQRWVIAVHAREGGRTEVPEMPPKFVPVWRRPGYSILRAR